MKLMMSRQLSRSALALLLLAPATASAICYSNTCAACTPPMGTNFVLSTLIPSAAFPGSTANEPVAFVDPDDGRPFRLVPVQEGAILVWDGTTGSFLATPFLDLRNDGAGPGLDKVLYGGERGLLAMVVDPDYVTTGHFWVYYTRVSDGDIVVERYQRSAGDPNVANTTGTVVLRIDHPATNHNGGWLAFGPDGFLYISTGDGGGGCDGGAGSNGDGQNPGTLSGKILRLDVRGVEPGAGAPECGLDANYGVPTGNWYVGVAGCDEVWTLGLRNPFRFSFDRVTGDMYIGDVGQDNWEEINLLRPTDMGAVNFGWVCREGCNSSSVAPSSCSIPGCGTSEGATCQYPTPSGKVDPILCHSNPNGWASIMGGYRYRGTRVPDLAARYVYGDVSCGQIWVTTSLDPAVPATTAAACWRSGFGGTYGFAEDKLGELYVVRGGANRIECIHDGNPGGCYWAGWRGMFEDGFETGDTSRWSAAVQ